MDKSLPSAWLQGPLNSAPITIVNFTGTSFRINVNYIGYIVRYRDQDGDRLGSQSINNLIVHLILMKYQKPFNF
jgi:hypothetical protein